MQLYRRTIIPQTQSILDLTEQETETGNANYQQLLDAQSDLFRAKLALEKARCDRLKAYALINQLTAPNGAEP
jgi:outer membrane protein TolC